MKKYSFFLSAVIATVVVSGCASSSSLERSANNHAKARDYYESIGQPDAAREENNEANKDWDNANDLLPVLVEVFNLFSEKDRD